MPDAPHHPRLLRHTPGTREPLGKNAAHRFASQHALVHYGSGTVFTFIPKNACTSLRISLALANGAIATVEEWNWVHKNNATFAATLPELARAPETALVLRCPFRRLASTFLDKIVSRQPDFWALYDRSAREIDPDRLTFRGFVDWIGRPGMLRANIHWRPQEDFLVYARYDHVFGMTGLDAFAAFFAQRTGHDHVDSRKFSGHTSAGFVPLEGGCQADTPLVELMAAKARGALPRAVDLFDDALAGQVARLYGRDLALLRDLARDEPLLFPEHGEEP